MRAARRGDGAYRLGGRDGCHGVPVNKCFGGGPPILLEKAEQYDNDWFLARAVFCSKFEDQSRTVKWAHGWGWLAMWCSTPQRF